MSALYIGLMSGTSIDGIDAALVELGTAAQPKLLGTFTQAIPNTVKQRIINLCTPGDNEIDRLGVLDIELGSLFASAANALIEKYQIKASAVEAIGSHGQTIRHRPPTTPDARGFTLQIGDPNTIAAETGITTVADFRRRDMAQSGQGAPLAPAFHQAIAPADIETCAFLNLGGIANFTLIHQRALACGFDTGPANTLLDAWIALSRELPYDRGGAWAKSGKVHAGLLTALAAHPYFSLPAPKSTGRETFSLAWLQQQLTAFGHIDASDVQATLLQLTCATIADACRALPQQPELIYCCGGGTANAYLMEQLAEHCAPCSIVTTDSLGIDPDWIEACAFGWLAQQTLRRTRLALDTVTGASQASILGGIYYADRQR